MVDQRTRLKRWQQSPIRDLLRKAAQGQPIRSETVDRLELPPKIRMAVDTAIRRVTPGQGRRVPGMGPGSPDYLSSEITDALYDEVPDWETPDERRERRAQEGDPEALASLKAQEEATDRMVARIRGDEL